MKVLGMNGYLDLAQKVMQTTAALQDGFAPFPDWKS